MKVFKFGGASVKDVESVKNVANIIAAHSADDLWIVVSAMGKTTNLLEQTLSSYWREESDAGTHIDRLRRYHLDIIDGLFPFSEKEVYHEVNAKIDQLSELLSSVDRRDYDRTYDQVVGTGEWLSTKIMAAYLNATGSSSTWVDAMSLIATNDNHREAEVDLALTREQVSRAWEQEQRAHSFSDTRRLITQGFVGGCKGVPTTLGREGSDYSAAILSWCLDAEQVTIWKDVPGVLNADPKYYADTQLLASISYREAIELSYYGASVIHPKTIKPLQNKMIPLYVRALDDLNAPGTVISTSTEMDGKLPCYIFKTDQVLISVSPKDFSFIMEEGMTHVFKCMRDLRLRGNMIQNSALSFSVCLDDRGSRIDQLMERLGQEFRVLHNRGVSLLTIRHYDEQTMARLLSGRKVLVEQRSRQTARFVVEGEFERVEHS